MHVPRMIVRVRHLGPDHLDDSRAGLDQPARQQAALAEGVSAVKVACGDLFAFEVKRFAGPSGDDQAEGALIVFVEVVLGDGLVHHGHPRVDRVAELGAAFEPHREDFGPELKVVDLDPVHLGHVHVVAFWVKRVRVVRLPEEPGGAAFADDV